MAKDFACLFVIDKWFLATKEMKPDCRGWYLNLILHQFDKGSLPNDIEELANLADVRISEYTQFQQVFEQVLKHKFQLNTSGRLENTVAAEILRNRKEFKEKRGKAGKVSAFVKYIRKLCSDEAFVLFAKSNVDVSALDTKDEHMLKQVYEHLVSVYVNVNKSIPEDEILTGESVKTILGENRNPDSRADTPRLMLMRDDKFLQALRNELKLDPEEFDHRLQQFSLKRTAEGTLYTEMKQVQADLQYFLNNWERNGTKGRRNGTSESKPPSITEMYNES